MAISTSNIQRLNACQTINKYENLMKELYEYAQENHTADEYKDFILSHVWIQVMGEN